MFIGIGALIFAKHPALHSLAQITIIGMFSVVMMAYLFPPLIFKWLVSVNGTYRVRPISIRRLFVTGFSAVVFFIQLATVYLLGGILFGIFRGKGRSKRIFRDYVRMCFWYDMNHIWGVHFNYINSSDEDFVKPAVIVCNHQSMLDTAFLMAVSSKIIIVANSHASSHFVTKKVFQWMDFYTIPDQESADIPHLSELVKEGYSIVVFPEGTRNEKSSILRFHKGAFYLAEKLHLDTVPIYLHGVNHVFPRNTLCTYPGKVTLEIGDRIKYGDKDYYGHDYKECTRLMRNLYNKKFQLMKKQYETIEYYVPFVLDRYRYRGTEIFRSVKRNLKNYKRQAEKYNSIDSSFIIVLNSGWGELSLLLALTKPDATVISVEKDEEKLLVSGIAAENVVNNITYMTELKENDESKSPYIINL
jgi:1-acyl-sn-glycerol-3-phosphate acyltransferase